MKRVSKDHPRAFGNGYAYAHDLIMEEILGRPLRAGEVVHHKNEVKTDNRPENLELTTASDHIALHNAERERNEKGRFRPNDLRVREWPTLNTERKAVA